MLKEKNVQIIGFLGALVSAWCWYQIYRYINEIWQVYHTGTMGDAPYYTAMIVISILAAAVILKSIYNKVNLILKWLAFSFLLFTGIFYIIAWNNEPVIVLNTSIYLIVGSVGNIAALIGCFKIRK